MKKYKIYIIVSAVILIISIIGGTFAFFRWNSEKEALVNVTVSSGTGSCELITDNELEMFPTYSKYHGRKIKLHAKQEMAEKAYITWDMVINEINGLQDSTFKYELVNITTGESYGSGTFENITNEEGSNTITFSNNEEVLGYNRDYEFVLYLWIDGTLGNNSLDMSNQKFDFDMNCSITGTDNGTVTEQNVLMIVSNEQSSSDYFLNGETITRREIKSVTFIENANIPEGAIDVSKEKKNSVMMWNSDADSEGLYDIYIGSKDGKVIIENANNLFSSLSNVTSIDLVSVNGLYISDMSMMFRGCVKLISIDLENFDTSNVTDMSWMFLDCNSLKNLSLGNFNTSKVTKMEEMFRGCSSLTNLDLSSFDTSNVTSMSLMFDGCNSLTSLNLSSFDTNNVTSMYFMFRNCSSLTSLDLSNFNTSKVTNMSNLFDGCSGLISLDLSNFDTSKVVYMGAMFYACKSLTTLDLINFNTSNVIDMGGMFGNCSSLTSLDLSSFDTSNVTNMQRMFGNCSSLTLLDLTSFDTSNVTNMQGMFADCLSLITLDVSSFDTNNVTTMEYMFDDCSSLVTLDLSNFDTSNVTNMEQMFWACNSLETLDLSKFDTSNVTNMVAMFSYCGNLSTIYVSSSWDISSEATSGWMFSDCYSLVGGAGTKYNSSYTDGTYARIDGGVDNPGYLTLKTI